MKKFCILAISFIMLSFNAEAYNALHEHSVHKSELHKMGSKQQFENRQYIQYYKGKSDYKGSSSWAYSPAFGKQKDIYVKKGIKYKIDPSRQEQKLKDLQEKDEEKILTEQNTATEEVSIDTLQENSSSQVKKTVEKLKILGKTEQPKPLNVKPEVLPSAKKIGIKTDNHNADAE